MNNQKIIIGENIQVILDWLNFNNANKIFLVTGKKSFERSGAKSYLQPILNKYPFIHFFEFKENPQIKNVYDGIERLNSEKCDCCIAVGGGSVIDMAKLISYLQLEEKNNPDFIVKNKLTAIKREIPLGVIPTTSGSGAEATHFAVVYIKGEKYSLAHKSILPDLVNLNTRLSYTTNPYLRAITGIDALAQGIESYWSKNATTESRKDSVEAIKLVWNNLKNSVLENDFEAHNKVAIGSNLAGKAINIAKTTACHAISYYFTSTHKLKHGHAVSLTLGKVYQFNYNKSLKTDNKTKQIFLDLNRILQIDENPRDAIERFISELNIELKNAKLNIKIKDELPNIIKGVNLERLSNNPFKIEESDFEKLILND